MQTAVKKKKRKLQSKLVKKIKEIILVDPLSVPKNLKMTLLHIYIP